MTAKKWSDIKAQRLTPEEIRRIDREVEKELLELAVIDGKRIKLAEG